MFYHSHLQLPIHLSASLYSKTSQLWRQLPLHSFLANSGFSIPFYSSSLYYLHYYSAYVSVPDMQEKHIFIHKSGSADTVTLHSPQSNLDYSKYTTFVKVTNNMMLQYPVNIFLLHFTSFQYHLIYPSLLKQLTSFGFRHIKAPGFLIPCWSCCSHLLCLFYTFQFYKFLNPDTICNPILFSSCSLDHFIHSNFRSQLLSFYHLSWP